MNRIEGIGIPKMFKDDKGIKYISVVTKLECGEEAVNWFSFGVLINILDMYKHNKIDEIKKYISGLSTNVILE